MVGAQHTHMRGTDNRHDGTGRSAPRAGQRERSSSRFSSLIPPEALARRRVGVRRRVLFSCVAKKTVMTNAHVMMVERHDGGASTPAACR